MFQKHFVAPLHFSSEGVDDLGASPSPVSERLVNPQTGENYGPCFQFSIVTYLAAHAPCLTALLDISRRLGRDEAPSTKEERYADIDTPATPLDFAIGFGPDSGQGREYPPPILEHYDDTTMGDQGKGPLLNADGKCFKAFRSALVFL